MTPTLECSHRSDMSVKQFPWKLHLILNEEAPAPAAITAADSERGKPSSNDAVLATSTRTSSTIAWLEDGKSFQVLDKERFASEIMPRYFKSSSYRSFQRNLNLWGFKSIGRGVFFHGFFLRWNPELCRSMVRVSVKKGAISAAASAIASQVQHMNTNTVNAANNAVVSRGGEAALMSGYADTTTISMEDYQQHPAQAAPPETAPNCPQHHHQNSIAALFAGVGGAGAGDGNGNVRTALLAEVVQQQQQQSSLLELGQVQLPRVPPPAAAVVARSITSTVESTNAMLLHAVFQDVATNLMSLGASASGDPTSLLLAYTLSQKLLQTQQQQQQQQPLLLLQQQLPLTQQIQFLQLHQQQQQAQPLLQQPQQQVQVQASVTPSPLPVVPYTIMSSSSQSPIHHQRGQQQPPPALLAGDSLRGVLIGNPVSETERKRRKATTTSGHTITPCKARGMPLDHNSHTAFLDITKATTHGTDLVCSHPHCRQGGIKFRYCLFCKVPAAKRTFGALHGHKDKVTSSTTSASRPTTIKDEREADITTTDAGNGTSLSSSTVVCSQNSRSTPTTLVLKESPPPRQSFKTTTTTPKEYPHPHPQKPQNILAIVESLQGHYKPIPPRQADNMVVPPLPSGLGLLGLASMAYEESRPRSASHSIKKKKPSSAPQADIPDQIMRKKCKTVTNKPVAIASSFDRWHLEIPSPPQHQRQSSSTSSSTGECRNQWANLLESRPSSGSEDEMSTWIMRVLSVSRQGQTGRAAMDETHPS